MSDMVRVADGGSSFRLVIGEYGAGKTFPEPGPLHRDGEEAGRGRADLNPDRRLHASGGQARSLCWS